MSESSTKRRRRPRKRKPETQINRVDLALSRLRSIRESGCNSIAVSFSGGKDSMVTLDLCSQVFPAENIHPYFLYMVRGLECEESILQRSERRYGVQIIRLPDPAIQHVLREAILIPNPVAFRRTMTYADIQSHIRKKTNCEWIAFGHRMDESLQRRGMISSTSGSMLGKSDRLKKVYPICDWVSRSVYSYLRSKRIEPPDNFGSADTAGFSLCSACLHYLRENWPDDYEKVCKHFPFAESIIVRDELRFDRQAALGMDW